MSRLASLSLGAVLFAAVLAGCSASSKPKVGAPTTATTASAGPASTGTTQPPVAKPLTNSNGRYTVTVVVGTPSTTGTFACSTAAHGGGRFNVPFTLTIKNEGTATTKQPLLGLIINDPQGAQGEVAAIKLPPCVDFTLEGNTLDPGQSATYEGSASNVSRNAELDVSLKVAAAGSPENDFIKVKLFT